MAISGSNVEIEWLSVGVNVEIEWLSVGVMWRLNGYQWE